MTGESSLLLFRKTCVKFANKGCAIRGQQIHIRKKFRKLIVPGAFNEVSNPVL